jgi:hypothetical protein
MPLNPRFAEDVLTNLFEQALTQPEVRSSFWKMVAPVRMRLELPDQTKSCAHELGPARLGGINPDIIFYRAGKPVFYVEAKLECGTEPLQLVRARSWMRAHGAQDDQVMLLSNWIDQIPSDVGWTGSVLPVRSATWQEIEKGLRVNYPSWSATSQKLFDSFSSFLQEKSAGSRTKTKQGMLFPSRHRYGEIMRRFTASEGYTKSDFLYGAGIDPRICLGRSVWQSALGTPDLERLEVHYGPGRQQDGENYRAAFHIWHESDLAHSREFIAQHWKDWREAILADGELQFIYGDRRGKDRKRPSEPPVECPKAWVGIVCRPDTKVYEAEIKDLAVDLVIKRLKNLVRPLERFVERVCEKLSAGHNNQNVGSS